MKPSPTFNQLSEKLGLYTPGIPLKDQCSGYHYLKKMVQKNIIPASAREVELYLKDPCFSPPRLKHLFFIHPILREVLRDKRIWAELLFSKYRYIKL